MWETWVWSLGWEDPLEKGKATNSSILSWRIPWTIQSMGSQGRTLVASWATFTRDLHQEDSYHQRNFSFLRLSAWRGKHLFTNHLCVFLLSLSCSVCPTLCDPMNCSIPGSSVLHCLPEFAQIHIHWVEAAIQQSHPLSPPSPPALNLFQHQSLFQWVGSLHQVAKYWSFSFSIWCWILIFRWIFNEYSEWVSFRIDWFDLLAIQGTHKGLPNIFSSHLPVGSLPPIWSPRALLLSP